jgi:hypothetical protein
MKDIFNLPLSVDSSILTSDLFRECRVRIFHFVNYLAIKFVIVASHWYLREPNVLRGVSESFCYSPSASNDLNLIEYNHGGSMYGHIHVPANIAVELAPPSGNKSSMQHQQV